MGRCINAQQNWTRCFVVPTSAVKEYFDNDNFEAYKIPDKYDNMNDLEEDLDNGRFDSKEIERLN